jgi:leucyl-tRNA synthetase
MPHPKLRNIFEEAMPAKHYDHNQIELKWSERWAGAALFRAEENSSKPKF